ncbi:MAG: ABC transporter permease [Chloroflexi bacterium]|nr:ABC transporter permease [Chloroflexota bacterium]MCI0575075.1 ABC transporter permease [Chloroflexota bacterium]MCI0643601.1 ABC transporter permease [Chloroflexota bacterium]MCI0726223.1 ABC transporter permease [Chloroflexota bacterium]
MDLPGNPIYRRERGFWGKPNPFYDNLSRFSPFAVLGAIGLGFCGGASNPSLLANPDSSLFFVYCLVCLPGVLFNVLTLFGTFMAPALTAPSISYERYQGTWELLCITPYSTASILLAKLFGALARLPIWRPLFALSLLQAGLLFCSTLLASEFLAGLLMVLVMVVRPWLDILFAALLGMLISTWLRSSPLALTLTYGGVLVFKIVSGLVLWLIILERFNLPGESILIGSSLGVVTFSVLAVLALFGGLMVRAGRINMSEI